MTSQGVVRVHGPVGRRCQGSGKPPCLPVAPVSVVSDVSLSSRGQSAASPQQPTRHTPSPPGTAVSFEAIPPVPVLKRIPKSAGPQAAAKLATILDDIVSHPDSMEAWERLYRFPVRCLRVPPTSRTPKHKTLSSLVKEQIRAEQDPCVDTYVHVRKPKKKGSKVHQFAEKDIAQKLAQRVSSKLEEGDFIGAVHLASSDEKLADFSSETFSALQAKHPVPHPDSVFPPSPPPSNTPAVVPAALVTRAIKSFHNGSAGGPDKLRPQHLKDLLQATDQDNSPFFSSLMSFSSLVLDGGVPPDFRPHFFGASLVALEKSGGGIRPIAVGWTLRRLIARIAGYLVVDDLAELFTPRQLGYGIRGGAEAIVHAGRKFLHNMDPEHVLIKLDFCNAFNSIRRDKMLEAVFELAPDIYPLVHSAYASPSNLLWGDKQLQSSEGVQQGDPLGPPLFCLALHRFCDPTVSPFFVMYLDDVSLGGSVDEVLQDLEVISNLKDLGLSLNNQKSEIICEDAFVRSAVLSKLPGARLVSPESACLLGSPIGDVSSIDASLQNKIVSLKRMGSRLNLLSAHDSLILLHHSLSVPKLQYLLRTAPCFTSDLLSEYDSTLRSILSSVTNTPVDRDDLAWLQASLPVRLGGLGVRRACQIAPSAYLASTVSSLDLVTNILPSNSLPVPSSELALSLWSQDHSIDPPQGEDACRQKNWDSVLTSLDASSLLNSAQDDTTRARLLAVMSKNSGAWLQALPVSSLGLRLDDCSLRIAVGLRLGTDICMPHLCRHCNSEVDSSGIHGLSCQYSEGRLSRHASINAILHRALTTANIPSRLELSGLSLLDGTRPNGMSIIPWHSGRLLVWDVTCPDTLAISYRSRASVGAGLVAALAEEKKSEKFAHLSSHYHFVPFAIESLGAMGPSATALIKDLSFRGRREKTVLAPF